MLLWFVKVKKNIRSKMLVSFSSVFFFLLVGTFDYPAVVNTVEISPDTITSSTNANITITGVTSKSLYIYIYIFPFFMISKLTFPVLFSW